MRKKIFHNWGLKLASLILAFLLWLLVVQVNDPKENQVFTGIPVTLTNTELLDQQNKFYEVLDNTDTVRVTVRGPKSVVDQLRSSDIVAEADMSKLTEINTIAISFSVINADTDVEVIGGNPDVLRLNVEDRGSKWIYVRYNTTGEVADGYMVTSVQPDQNRIEVTGPKSAVDQISYARVEVDVSDATTNVSANVEIVLYDKEGNPLDLPNVTKSVNTVRLQAEVLATKRVAVELNYMGVPEDGFLITGVTECDPSAVLLAGTASALENARIVIPEEALDITDAVGNVSAVIDIGQYLPSGTRLAEAGFNGRVTATVYIEPKKEQTFVIDPTRISVTNVPEGLVLQETDGAGETYELRISGLEDAVLALQNAAPAGSVDVAAWMEEEGIEELRAGTYDIPVEFLLPEGIVVEDPVSLRLTFVEQE